MNQDFLKSIAFHLVIAILLVVSTWSIFSRHEQPLNETPIVVSLAPMGEKTNVKPAPKREVTPPTPKKPEPKPEPKKPEPKPEPKKPEPKKPEPKPDEKKPEKKPEKPKEKADELDALLKNLDEKPKPEKSSDEADTKEDSKSDQKFDPNSPEALSEQDYIVKLITDQVKLCWSPPVGGLGAKNMIVRVNVDIERDGTMKFIAFEGGQNSDPIYQAAADRAKAAVLDPDCNPLRQLPPPDKYSIWKEMTLIFDPKDLAN